MSAPEFEGQPMTKREVLIARDAFLAACGICANEVPQWKWQAEQTAAARYPLPKVTRPRVVNDPESPNVQWRYSDGRLEARVLSETTGWMRWLDYRDRADYAPIPERVRVWADLLANPAEEVEA